MDTRETERRRNAFSCSVVVPARNEAGTIDDVIRQVPEMGCGTEVIVVEGHSTDGTWKRLTHLYRCPRPLLASAVRPDKHPSLARWSQTDRAAPAGGRRAASPRKRSAGVEPRREMSLHKLDHGW